MFKFTVFVIVVAAVYTLADDSAAFAEYKKICEECMKETSVTREEIDKHFKDPEIPENVLYYLRCINQKFGIISEDGNLDHDKLANNPMVLKTEESNRKQLLECAGKIKKVENCKAMVPLKDCYMNLKQSLVDQ